MKNNNTKIEMAFDVSEDKIGTEMSNVAIYSMGELEKRLIEEKISVVILTVPVGAAQQITDRLVNTEVKGILNFTPARLTVPSHIRVHHIDLAVELQSLVYFLKNYSKKTKKIEQFLLDSHKNCSDT